MTLNQKLFILILLLLLRVSVNAQSITQKNGLKVIAVQKDYPLLKLFLPGQSGNDRGIEIEFPEHVTGLNTKTNKVEHLYLVTNGTRNKRTLPAWRVENNSLIYETELDNKVKMTATARLEADGLRYIYTLSNHSNIAYQHLQAVTCVKLYALFSDTLLQRTYVHHTDGFDLLASETPRPLAMPCRYLVSYTWPVSANRIEDGIQRYYKSRKVDKPFMATFSRDKKWIAATYTKETGNLWTNPERSCQHADPAVDLNPGQTKTLELKTFIIKGTLEQLLSLVNAEMRKK